MKSLAERAGVERPEPVRKRPSLAARARGEAGAWLPEPNPGSGTWDPWARPRYRETPEAAERRRAAEHRLQLAIDAAKAGQVARRSSPPAPPSPATKRVVVRTPVRDSTGFITQVIEHEQALPAEEVHLLEAAQLVVEQVVGPVVETVGDLLTKQEGHTIELNRLLGALADALRAQPEKITVAVDGAVMEQIQALARRIEALEAR